MKKLLAFIGIFLYLGVDFIEAEKSANGLNQQFTEWNRDYDLKATARGLNSAEETNSAEATARGFESAEEKNSAEATARGFESAEVKNSAEATARGFESAEVKNSAEATARRFGSAEVKNSAEATARGFESAEVKNSAEATARGFESAEVKNSAEATARGFKSAEAIDKELNSDLESIQKFAQDAKNMRISMNTRRGMGNEVGIVMKFVEDIVISLIDYTDKYIPQLKPLTIFLRRFVRRIFGPAKIHRSVRRDKISSPQRVRYMI